VIAKDMLAKSGSAGPRRFGTRIAIRSTGSPPRWSFADDRTLLPSREDHPTQRVGL